MFERSKLGLYFETILEIIEDKPNFIIPIYFYCLLVQVLFHQIAGYIFSNFETKPLTEEKISFIAHINEVSPLTFLLFFKGNDTLSLICFFFMQFLMYFYFVYVGILTYLKNVKKYFYQQNSKMFRSMNQFLNVFFTFYWWLFFTPYIEINSGMLVCGDNSFLVAFRGQDCSGKSPLITILSVLGLILSVGTAFIIVFFFRNYEFNEQNLLKRRFHFIIVIQLLGRFLLTFFYYLNLNIVLVFKHVVAQFIAISFLYDTLMNWPFSNHIVAKFYSCAACIFEISIFLCNAWMFGGFMPGTEFFYFLAFLSLISSAIMIQLWRYKYEQIMKFDEEKFITYYKQTDFFLEEIIRLLIDSQRDEGSKFKLFETLIYHIKTCKNVYCHCKKTTFKKANNDINEEDVFRLVDSIFKQTLQTKILQKSLEEFEHLSLKYISYLAKYRNNTSRAYFELKVLLSQRTNISFYFKIISKILSKAIETQMEQSNIKNNVSKEYREDLELSLVWKMEELKSEFVPKMALALEQKISFWEKMKQGFNKMEDAMKYSVKKIRQIEELDTYFQLELSRMNGDQKNSYIYYKVCSMFEILVKNQVVNAMKLEISANELRKRDQSKPVDTIHNFKIAKQQIISFLVSFAKERGKIVSKKSAFTAKFFGYETGEQESIRSINDLMPKFIANIHNDLMENMNWQQIKNLISFKFHAQFYKFNRKGTSKYIKGSIKSYCSDKLGYIYPVKIFLDHSFGHFDDFCLLASIVKVTTSNDYIVFDETGKILGMSEQIYQKVFSNEKKMNLQKVYRVGYIFLLFKDIINQINNSKKELGSNYTEQQLIQLTNTNKGYFNLNQNFDTMFDLFQQFLQFSFLDSFIQFFKYNIFQNFRQMNYSKEIDNSRTMVGTKKNPIVNKRNMPSGSKLDASTTALKRPQLDLLNESTLSLLSQFFDHFQQRKADIQNQKQFSTHSDNNSQNLDLFQIRLFFKYQLQFETLRYHENKSEVKIFHLILSDLAISKRKIGSSYQSNMSLNTYINSTQVGGASSYKLKTFISKGGDTDIGGSIKLSDENKRDGQNQQKQSHFQQNNQNQQHTTQENVLDTNNQFENKFDQANEDEEWSNTEKQSDKSEEDGHDYKQKIMEQKSDKKGTKKKDTENLENIVEVPNREEDTNKQISIKNDSVDDSSGKKQKINNKYEDLNIPSQISKQSTQDPSKGIKEPLVNNFLDKSFQNAAPNASLINDSILNESNFILINNNNVLNSSFQDEQHMLRNNLAAQSTTNRNYNQLELLSLTSRNNVDESQRPVLKGGPDHRQAEFFSPTNNMRQLLDQDEILITMDDQKAGEVPPINLRFMDEQNERVILEQQLQDNEIQKQKDKAFQKAQSIKGNQISSSISGGVLGNGIYIDSPDLIKSSSLNPVNKQVSMDDDAKNEDLEKDLERIKRNRSLKESRNSSRGKKKKYSLKSEQNQEDEGNQQQSLASHSSIRSSYGTQFVREILSSKRLPNAAKNYNLVQKLFLLSFLIIIIINIFYLSQQITAISQDMDNYIIYANLTTSGSKGLLSLIGIQGIQKNLMTTNVALNSKLFNSYLADASNQFQQSYLDIEKNFIININNIFSNEDQFIDYQDFNYLGQQKKSQISVLQLLYIFQNALRLASTSSTTSNTASLRVAYYQLRYNYQQFMERMFTLKEYQDKNIDDSISNINSLYTVSTVISCLLCICVVIASIPMIRKINLFKEKIILLVTRIKVDDADLEIGKYKQCIEELKDASESYMNVDFFKIFTSRRKFHKRKKVGGGEELKFDDDLEHTYKVLQKGEGGQQLKQTVKKPKLKKSSGLGSHSKFKQNVISSKIFDQKIGLTKQFLSFLSFSFITIGFFIIILVYVFIKDNSITPSLRISRVTLNTQYSLGSLYIFSELIAIEKELSNADTSYPVPSLADRKLLIDYLNSDIKIIQEFNQENINNVYGDNIISSSSLNQIKNLYQNNLCNEFEQYTQCSNFNEGISGYISQLFSVIQSHNKLFDVTQFPSKTEVTNYLATAEHQRDITEAYIVPDQSLYLFNKIIIDANVDLVKNMSLLIQIVFYTAGPIIFILLAIFFLKQWINLTTELNSLSFLLTLIPEEKISEEITLQMLKQIRTF